jgi:hypothetical protein
MNKRFKLTFKIKGSKLILHSSIGDLFLYACLTLAASYLVYNGSMSIGDLFVSDLAGVEYYSTPEDSNVTGIDESPEAAQKRKSRAELYDRGLQCLFVVLVIGGLALWGIAPYYTR